MSNEFKQKIRVKPEELKNDENVKIGKHYAISDVHGMYGSYMKAIEKLTKQDHLYIVGDVIDRGEEGIKILLDIMERQNNPNNGPQITFLIGNHEVMFLQTVNIMLTRGLNRDDLIKLMECDNFSTFYYNVKDRGVTVEEAYAISNWIRGNHGDKTIFTYLEQVDPSTRKKIYNFLLESYVVLPQKIGEQHYLFVHAMPINDKAKLEDMKQTRKGYNIMELTLDEYRFMLTEREEKTYKQAQEAGFITICGHTPTNGVIVNEKEQRFVRIDAGCGHKKEKSKLALYCIEDDKVQYIDEKRENDLSETR